MGSTIKVHSQCHKCTEKYINHWRVLICFSVCYGTWLFAASMLKYFSRYGEVIDCVVMNKKLSYRRETARQLPTWRG